MEICEKRASMVSRSCDFPPKLHPPKNFPSWAIVIEPQEDCQVLAPVCRDRSISIFIRHQVMTVT